MNSPIQPPAKSSEAITTLPYGAPLFPSKRTASKYGNAIRAKAEIPFQPENIRPTHGRTVWSFARDKLLECVGRNRDWYVVREHPLPATA